MTTTIESRYPNDYPARVRVDNVDDLNSVQLQAVECGDLATFTVDRLVTGADDSSPTGEFLFVEKNEGTGDNVEMYVPLKEALNFALGILTMIRDEDPNILPAGNS